MNSKTNLLKSPLVWTLAAGCVIGAASVISFPNMRTASLASPAVAQTAPSTQPITSLDVNSMAALKALDASFATLAEMAEPAVVHIKVESPTATNMFGDHQVLGGE